MIVHWELLHGGVDKTQYEKRLFTNSKLQQIANTFVLVHDCSFNQGSSLAAEYFESPLMHRQERIGTIGTRARKARSTRTLVSLLTG